MIALLSTATGVHAQGCEPWVARIISVQGAGRGRALGRTARAGGDGRYLLLWAGLLFSVGRVAKAEADLAEAERADPKSGGAAALRSVIALVRDQKDGALRLAETGAGLDPNSPLPQAALSYAHQGRFEIEKALENARRAVELAPEDALLWARVSELELSRGDLDAALEAAHKAETLSPALARTQTVLGFAYLTRIEVDKAKTAFERAIQGDATESLAAPRDGAREDPRRRPGRGHPRDRDRRLPRPQQLPRAELPRQGVFRREARWSRIERV
ncbi:MAG: hypothetical protein M3461_16330 [Pseudomonadota bacterium]|nr:hypothetical protein [Pseudomonadota bacterium]